MPGRASLTALRHLVASGKLETTKKHAAKIEKKQKRQVKKEAAKSKNVPDFLSGVSERGQSSLHVVNSKDVREWLLDGIADHCIGRVDLPKSEWGVKECAAAKRLLKIYGEEKVQEAVFYFCRNWDSMKAKNNKLYGLPTVNYLWGAREAIFAEAAMEGERGAQLGSQVGEFKGGRKRNGIGW